MTYVAREEKWKMMVTKAEKQQQSSAAVQSLLCKAGKNLGKGTEALDKTTHPDRNKHFN